MLNETVIHKVFPRGALFSALFNKCGELLTIWWGKEGAKRATFMAAFMWWYECLVILSYNGPQ